MSSVTHSGLQENVFHEGENVDAFGTHKNSHQASTANNIVNEPSINYKTSTRYFPLMSRHFSFPATSHVTIKHLPKTRSAGEQSDDGSALNTGLSVWFGSENMIENLCPVLDEITCVATDLEKSRSNNDERLDLVTSEACCRSYPNKIIELGAGTGITSLFVLDYFAARKGLRIQVDITDGIDEVLDLLKTNVRLWVDGRDDIRSEKERHSQRSIIDVSVRKKLWQNTMVDGGDGGYPDGGYDLAYGSDLIYERDEENKVEALASTVFSMLSGKEKYFDFHKDDDVAAFGNNDIDDNGVSHGKEYQEISSALLQPEDGYLNEFTFVPSDQLSRLDKKFFLLAFTRRSYPLVGLINKFVQADLKYEGTLENSCWDLFDNNTNGLTDMWRDCILVFSLRAVEIQDIQV